MMKRRTVLFGAGKFAELLRYCLTHDSDHTVVGFAVDESYLPASSGCDLPVVDFARIERVFPPEENMLMFGIGSNPLRRDRFSSAKDRGYEVGTYISSRAITWPDLSIGEGVLIFEGTIIQPYAQIGRDTAIRGAVHLSHHVAIGDHCFIAPGACLGGGAVVENGCFIGLNATVRNGITIAEGCSIGAGAVVIADTDPDGVYVGVPAQRIRSRT
jgi:sugar O-acyltransferase (sialic acid O-acetyltransferase NeuD family)